MFNQSRRKDKWTNSHSWDPSNDLRTHRAHRVFQYQEFFRGVHRIQVTVVLLLVEHGVDGMNVTKIDVCEKEVLVVCAEVGCVEGGECSQDFVFEDNGDV